MSGALLPPPAVKFDAADLDYLTLLGFEVGMARNALMTRNRDQAAVYLRDIRTKSEMSIWEPPIGVRVGSWLPNVLDEASGTEHTVYFLSVTLLSRNYTWQLSKRYALFHNLYHELKRDLAKAFPSKMMNPFPEDRVKAWLYGMSDKVRDRRRAGISLWLSEVLTNDAIMLNFESLKKIHSFLEVDVNVKKLREGVNQKNQTGSSSSTMLTQPVSERFMKRMQTTSGAKPERSVSSLVGRQGALTAGSSTFNSR